MAYPFDPTGVSSANKVLNEIQTISPTTLRDYQFIIPKNAPFFKDGFTITFTGTDGVTKTLLPGVDFLFTHKFMDASKACSKGIYGSIMFNDKSITGTLKYNYQTLGGDWCLDSATILALLAQVISDPRRTSWDSIVALPYSFPVIDHQWQILNMVGASDVVEALLQLKQSIDNQTNVATRLTTLENNYNTLAVRVTALENK